MASCDEKKTERSCCRQLEQKKIGHRRREDPKQKPHQHILTIQQPHQSCLVRQGACARAEEFVPRPDLYLRKGTQQPNDNVPGDDVLDEPDDYVAIDWRYNLRRVDVRQVDYAAKATIMANRRTIYPCRLLGVWCQEQDNLNLSCIVKGE